MTEDDDNYDDSDAIMVDCSALPLGELDFELVIKEDSGTIQSVAQVADTAGGWLF
jgi:hypothetical protein